MYHRVFMHSHRVRLIVVCIMLVTCASLLLKRGRGGAPSRVVESLFHPNTLTRAITARFATSGERRGGDFREAKQSNRSPSTSFSSRSRSSERKPREQRSASSNQFRNNSKGETVSSSSTRSADYVPAEDITVPGVNSRVILEKGKARIFQEGNPIVYGGAVKEVIGDPSAGDEVLVTDYMGNIIARGVFNPYSQYRVRLLAWKHETSLFSLPLADLLAERLRGALSLRSSLRLPSKETNAFRLVNSEGDLLSGLIVDVLGEYVVAQSSAFWVEQKKELVQEALEKALGIHKTQRSSSSSKPSVSLLWKQAETRLKQDGYTSFASQKSEKTTTSSSSTTIVENGIQYTSNPEIDQKTGFYCDQRDNRMLIRSLLDENQATRKDVLDLYCYTGGFAMNAIRGGAKSVVAVDSSKHALETAANNAKLNGMSSEEIINVSQFLSGAKGDSKESSIQWLEGDCVEVMQAMAEAEKTFDIVICDPPKLAPTRQSLDKALTKYQQINSLAMQLVNKKEGGLLLTCTCSAAMTQAQGDGKSFHDMLQRAARQAKRNVRFIQQSNAARDHVTSLAYPESSYLTAVLLYVY